MSPSLPGVGVLGLLSKGSGAVLTELGSSAMELLRAAGLWGSGAAAAGIAAGLLMAGVAALWTRGRWAAGCLWALLLSLCWGSAGLYAGATWGIARHCERMVAEEYFLERSAVTALLALADDRELLHGELADVAPLLGEARVRLSEGTAIGAVQGAAALGMDLPQMAGLVLDHIEGLGRVPLTDLRELHLGVESVRDEDGGVAASSNSVRELLASTAPLRRQAEIGIWSSTSPHFVAAAVLMAAPLGLILVVGLVVRVVRRAPNRA